MKLQGINLSYLFAISSVSFLIFVVGNQTAYDWPAIDMMPFFERYFNDAFLRDDFFTNAISNEPNPRWIFGYFIIGLSEIFKVDWYVISYTLKLFLVIFLPVLFYVMIYLVSSNYIDKVKLKRVEIVLLIAILLVLIPSYSAFFSIAWWKPYLVQATSQTLSIFLGLLAITVSEIEFSLKKIKVTSLILFAFTTAMHPSIGLFVITFYFLNKFFYFKNNYKQLLIIFSVGFVVPVIVIKLLFGSYVSLDVIDFVNIYAIENHSSHYHLKDFGTLNSFNWVYTFTLMLLLMIMSAGYFFIKKHKKAFNLSVLFIVSYIMSVMFQYFFIDVFPSKIIASIGPVRFTIFAYWMLVILLLIIVSDIKRLDKYSFKVKLTPLYVFILGGYFVFGIINIDNPKQELLDKNSDIYDFVNSTSKNSVYAVYFGSFMTDLPNVGNRAVFTGNGFPFNEAYFIEYSKRTKLLYGSRKDREKIDGTWIGEKMANFFRRLKPSDFTVISKKYKLNYVLIEKNHSQSFSKFKPKFENNKFEIYSVNDFELSK